MSVVSGKESRREAWKALADVGSIGIEMGLSVAVGYWIGQWLDTKFDTSPWLMYFFLFAGIGAAFKGLLRVARKGMAADAAASSALGTPPAAQRSQAQPHLSESDPPHGDPPGPEHKHHRG